jgi:NAD(P)-dependent dehydrogenase (short-subunit alcohol dehydrogenase family)
LRESTRESGDGQFVKTDVSQAADVHALAQKTVEKFGGLHVAFNYYRSAKGSEEKAPPFRGARQQ